MIKFDNKVITINNDWLKYDTTPVDPYNPLGLPPFTIRAKFTEGYTPTQGDTQTLVDSSQNIWDITNNSEDWTRLFYYVSQLIEVLGANTSGVTNMYLLFGGTPITSVPLFDTSSVVNMANMLAGTHITTVPLFDTSSVMSIGGMFDGCSSLTSVPLFNTSKVTFMAWMFQRCSSLTSVPLFDTSKVNSMAGMFKDCSKLTTVPLFDTSKVTNMFETFMNCTNVQSGALALYQQASTQQHTVQIHNSTFKDCGTNTTTGLAELQQIPTSWGGLKEE